LKLAYQGVTVDLSLTSAQDLGEFGVDRFFGFEGVYGSYGNDTFLGTDGVNHIDGNDGDDVLYGRDGNALFMMSGDGLPTSVGGLGRIIFITGTAAAAWKPRDVAATRA
jgi:Ca2+-binding RTX toxin-like protein